jgi:uncharacterized peroxidase-related enzyme
MAFRIKGVEPHESQVVDDVERETGASNFLRIMAHRPEAMRDFHRFYDDVMGAGSLLDRRTKEMVYLAVSFVNECNYCSSHHIRSARQAELTEGEIREIEVENNQHFTPREQAALHYARELTRTASVGDDIRYRAQELFATDEFVELTLIVALANFTNRFSNGLTVPVEAARGVA